MPFALFLLNLLLVRRLLFIEYLDQMGSIEGSFIAIARWARDNWGDLSWFPLWYGGIPNVNTYPPLLHRSVAAVSTVLGLSPAHAYHAVTAVIYSLGPVTLYWLALKLCGSRAWSFAAGAFYSLVSTSALLIPAVASDAGGVWGTRRLQAMVVYGEGPHITGLTLLPVAILLLSVAFDKRRPHWWFLAALSLGGVSLSNWIGAAALAMAAAAWLLARQEGAWWRNWMIAAALAAPAYLIVSPGIPVSAILGVVRNERYVSGGITAHPWEMYAAAAALCVAAAGLRALRVAERIRFALLFLLPTAAITLGYEWFRVSLAPQASRYHLEMEMALALLAAFLAQWLFRRFSRRAVAAVACLAVAAAAYGAWRCARTLAPRIRPVEIEKTIEYTQAAWFDRNMGGRRVFAPGSVGFFMNVFTDTPQFAGGFDQGAVNPLLTHARYQILSGENAGEQEGEVAVLWLKAFGVDAVAVSGPASKEVFKPFRNPRKFDGLLPELRREGDDVIYRVPRRSQTLAHVIRPAGLAPRAPMHGVDVEPLRSYVAALDDPSLPPASFQWRNHHSATISATLEPDQLLSVQITHHRGWKASVEGRSRPVRRDNLGQMVIEPGCNGACTVELAFDGGAEMLVLRFLSWSCLGLGLVWSGWGILHRRRNPVGR